MAAPSALRSVHEAVLPKPPLPPTSCTPTPPSLSPPPSVPLVTGAVQQRYWLEQISLMRAVPGADQAELDEIAAHITNGVSLPLLSEPPTASFPNTPTVSENAEAVRARLK